jgi:hypothetical protein
MQFTNTLSRAQLQDAPDKRRRQAIVNYCDQLHNLVHEAATYGKSSYLHTLQNTDARSSFVKSSPGIYIPTPEDIMEGLKLKFPDCDITLFDDWVDVRPGVREQRKGILISWA